jgi:tetratricopeptide (TPR) repeat protein
MTEHVQISPPGDVADEPITAARQALEAGRLDEAERRFRLLIDGPMATEAQKGIGDVLFRKGRLAKAADTYRTALKLRPNWPEVENNLGGVYKAQGNTSAAEQQFRRALSINPLLSAAGNNLGVLLAEKGELIEAATRFKDALSLPFPKPEVRQNLARALMQLGRIEEAAAEFVRAMEENPEDPETLLGMARLRRETGRPSEALELARKALQLRPGFAEAYLEMGEAALALDKLEDAVIYCRHAVEVSPNAAKAHEALGSALLNYGALQEAELYLRRALALTPRSAPVLVKLGSLLEQQDRSKDAEKNYRDALEINRDYVPALNCLGNLLLKQRRPQQAVLYFGRVSELCPDDALAHSNLAAALNDLHRHAEAADACRKAIELNHDLAEAHQNLGAIQQTLGQLDEACASYERALELKPNLVQTIFSLANLKTQASSDSMLNNIATLLKSERLSDAARAQLYFALVNIHNTSGNYEAAFQAAIEGNALEMRRQPYEPAKLERLVSELKGTFTSGFFDKRKSYGATSDRPIFIVGVPRSGTTLVEQVLASHPEVFGAGEIAILPNLAGNLKQWARTTREFPRGLLEFEEPDVLRLAGAYRRHTRDLAGPTRRVTDKMTSNIFYLGLIALLFPRAKIIYCRRDPFDLFISNYFMLFRRPMPYSTSQESFAHFYNLQQSIFAHWQAVLPLKIHELKYESFVADQETQTRALLQHCELDWDARCLNFHLTERPILTGSDIQVRQPLYKSSVGRARPYMKYLDVLNASLTNATR